MSTPADNPFSAPTTDAVDSRSTLGSDAEVVRRAHLGHEAGLRSVSSVFVVFGAVAVFWAGTLLVIGIRMEARPSELAWSSAIILLGGLLFIPIAIELRRLRPRSRWPALFLCLLSIAIFPIGTVVGGYGAMLLLSNKGQTVLSKRYEEVRAQTPHLRVRTPRAAWLALAALVLLVGIAVAFLHF